MGMLAITVAEEFGYSIHMEAGEVSAETYLIHKTETSSVKNRLQKIYSLEERENKKLFCVFLDSQELVNIDLPSYGIGVQNYTT